MYFIRFMVLVNLLYFSVFRRQTNITKIFIFTIFFIRIQVCFQKNQNNWGNKNNHGVAGHNNAGLFTAI